MLTSFALLFPTFCSTLLKTYLSLSCCCPLFFYFFRDFCQIFSIMLTLVISIPLDFSLDFSTVVTALKYNPFFSMLRPLLSHLLPLNIYLGLYSENYAPTQFLLNRKVKHRLNKKTLLASEQHMR